MIPLQTVLLLSQFMSWGYAHWSVSSSPAVMSIRWQNLIWALCGIWEYIRIAIMNGMAYEIV